MPKEHKLRNFEEGATYASPRWSYEILDCAMPMTFDTYSNCAFQCVYCFAYFRRAIGNTKEDYLSHKVKVANIERVKKMFLDPDKYAGAFGWYIKQRMVLQWGGLSDGFDWYERELGYSLDLLRFFREIDYPISISTKGTWFLDVPEYVEAFKDAKNVHVKISIITMDKEKAAKIERGVVSPQERMLAIKRLNDLGVGATTVRFRPFIPFVSELTMDEIVEEGAKAGAYSLTTEWLCLEMRATENHFRRYDKISEIAGVDLFEYYKRHTQYRYGLLRLNYDLKRPYIEKLQSLCDEHGLKFFISDAHHPEKSYNSGCCGLPSDGPLSNVNRGQFKEAILIAKEKGEVRWPDIGDKAEGLKNIAFYNAEGFNQGTSRERAKRRFQSMWDYMRDIWNHPSSSMSPAKYFGGVLVPSGRDEEGDIIYTYNEPFVNLKHSVQSVQELQNYQHHVNELRQDGETYGHVAFPVYVDLTQGLNGHHNFDELLDANRLNYVIVCKGAEVSDVILMFPQGSVTAGDSVEEVAKGDGEYIYWKVPQNFEVGNILDSNGKQCTIRAAFSAVEAGLSGFDTGGATLVK